MSKKDENLWFKSKKHGYGWGLPIKWQGWAVLAAHAIIIVTATVWIDELPDANAKKQVGIFLVIVFVSTLALILTVNAHGPKLKWRWGEKDTKKKSKTD